MKRSKKLLTQPKHRLQGLALVVLGVLLISMSFATLTFASAEDREGEPTDRDTNSDRPTDRPTDRDNVGRDRREGTNDRDGERDDRPTDRDDERERPERERPDPERIRAIVTRLREAAANGDKEAAMKLRHILARLNGGEERERPERERPDRERPDRERLQAYVARLRAAVANGDQEAAQKLRHLFARLDAIKDGERERPEMKELPNQERIDAYIARLKRAAANGDGEAALKLRHLLARLDAIKDGERERPDRDDVPERERPNQERIDATIAKLRRTAANGDEEAALKLRHLLARLDAA